MTLLQPLVADPSADAALETSGEGGRWRAALVVRSRSRLCALPVEHVIETLRPLPAEPLSGAPTFVRGVAVIRGEVVPVVDLGALLGSAESADPSRFVTLRIGNRRVALAVERVLGVRHLEPRLAREVPPLLGEVEAERLAAVATLDNELLLILRAARLLPAELWDALASAGSGAGNGWTAASAGKVGVEDARPPAAEGARAPRPIGQGTP